MFMLVFTSQNLDIFVPKFGRWWGPGLDFNDLKIKEKNKHEFFFFFYDFTFFLYKLFIIIEIKVLGGVKK